MINIQDIIHEISTTNIYKYLYFTDFDEIIDVVDFSFVTSNDNSNDSLKQDVIFFLDNIIAKIFELNFNVDYTKTTKLGGKIIINNETYKNNFLINDYIFNTETNILDLENYINDIQYIFQNNKYFIKVKIPIYKLNHKNITVI